MFGLLLKILIKIVVFELFLVNFTQILLISPFLVFKKQIMGSEKTVKKEVFTVKIEYFTGKKRGFIV